MPNPRTHSAIRRVRPAITPPVPPRWMAVRLRDGGGRLAGWLVCKSDAHRPRISEVRASAAREQGAAAGHVEACGVMGTGRLGNFRLLRSYLRLGSRSLGTRYASRLNRAARSGI